MNRIILIGNGFDLAHGMKTSYRDFIDGYWGEFIEGARKKEKYHEDECVNITTTSTTYNLVDILPEGINTYRALKSSVHLHFSTTDFSINNRLLTKISDSTSNKSWVDIENEYYQELKDTFLKKKDFFDRYNVRKLNEEFSIIEKLLEKYLTKVEKETQPDSSVYQNIKENIYSLIDINDLANSFENEFIKEIENQIHDIENWADEEFMDTYNETKKIHENLSSNPVHIENFIAKYLDEAENEDDAYEYLIDEVHNEKIPDYFLTPNDILFLNFNYTNTSDFYQPENAEPFNTIHIHGELNSEENPMIFGYGDELAEDYKQIENLNDNEYLKNVKSIRYLETDNYRQLLNFIESEPYQIFVMGHSCGNSDRTLLNTLFEHKNCVSIKPFYHKRADGSDNYSEIVQNISRNFKDKALMRERVVNKTYCEPLTEPQEPQSKDS
ncbi:MAG: AbiH family protein [Dysgonomonas sp.]|nr:AbiH family protein [Dysgonomonas sp.]